MLTDTARPVVLTFRLLWRFWPQLVALVLIGIIAGNLLMQLAANIAHVDHMLGLALLTLVALAQLVVTVSMFQVLRPALPGVRAAQAAASEAGGEPAGPGVRLARMVTIALIPFFAYYAAWGFLGDTVRQYSRLALELTPFGENGNVLDVLDSGWLVLSVAVAFLVRAFAKSRLARRNASAFWQVVVVVCETNWIFVGLYVISRWKDDVLAWIMSRNVWSWLRAAADGLDPVGRAFAAAFVPVEQSAGGLSDTLVGLFFYMLLPVIWLVMAALIYGYDVRNERKLMSVDRRLRRFGARYRSVPRFLRDFIGHFIDGYRSRYLPIANGVRLTLNSGLILIATLIVGYRLIDWLAAWAWLGTSRLIGPHHIDQWQVIAKGVSLLFGSPYQDSSTGILVEPLRICFLAAVLETAFGLPKRIEAAASVPQPAA